MFYTALILTNVSFLVLMVVLTGPAVLQVLGVH